MEKWENIVSIAPVIRFFCLDDESVSLNNHKINDFIQKNNFVHNLLATIFHKQNQKLNIEIALNSYGLKGLRDRITSLYIGKFSSGYFPDTFNLDIISDIIEFENRFSDFASSNNYRTYILGYFLKVYNENQFNKGLEEILIPIDIDEILLKGRIRSKRLDWIILTLALTLQYLDKDDVIKELDNRPINLMSLFVLIPAEIQNDIFSLLLLYAHAIGETEMFTFKRV